MNRNVILVSSGAAFMVNAIRSNLEKAGFAVVQAEPKVDAFQKCAEQANMILLYTGPYVSEIPEFLVYLKDICVDGEKELILLGDEKEIEEVEKTIPSAALSAEFKRPFDIAALVENLELMAAANEDAARRRKILLVDDDNTFLRMVKSWLDVKYNVVIVNSGMQAITYLATNQPDLILLDYEMPVTSGPQVLEMIRSEVKTESTPVIFLTGKGDKESVMKVVGLKPDGYLLKTLSREELVQKVDEFFVAKKGQGV